MKLSPLKRVRQADPFTVGIIAARVLLGLLILGAYVCMWVFAPLVLPLVITGISLFIGLVCIAVEPL